MNKILKCIAIDDEPMALLIIEQFCKRKGQIQLNTYSEPKTGLEEIQKNKPDLVFLDIHMNSINGLEIANIIHEKCCIIFTTAYAEFAIEGFNLDAVDFLHKPFSYERFEQAIEKAIRRINSFSTPAPEYIIVKQEYNNINIPLDDIIYIEAVGNYVKIIRDGEKNVLTRTNMKNIIDLLPKDKFLRIHRSYLISLSKIESFTRKEIKMKGNDNKLPVGSLYVNDVMDFFDKKRGCFK